jgi:hypothetical protein
MLPQLYRLTLLSFLSVAFGLPCLAQNCPLTPNPTISSSQPPTDECIPDGFGKLPIDYFDDYSWRILTVLRDLPDPSMNNWYLWSILHRHLLR